MAPYRASVRVRFAEIDRAGIVYYPRFFHYFHIAFEEFFDDCVGTPYHDLIDRRRIGFPTVHLECDYRAPLNYGDRLEVRLSVLHLGDSSVKFLYRIHREGEEAAAEATVTVVCVDMDSFRPIPVPDDLRAVFERFREEAG